MDWSNFLETIYNLAIGLLKVIGSVWNWLSEPLVDGFSPIELLGVGLSVLIGIWIAKELL